MSGLYTTVGVIFRSFKYGESSMIADVYSKTHGLRSYIAGGIRTKKSSGKVNVFYPGNIIEITSYPANEEKLGRLKEINYAVHYNRINQSVITFSVVAFLMEICRKSIREKEANEALYGFIVDRLMLLDSGEIKLKLFHIKFLLELSSFIGFEPYNNYSEEYPLFDLREGVFVEESAIRTMLLDKDLSLLLSQLLSTDFIGLNELNIDNITRDKLLDKLLEFYDYHIVSFGKVKSLEILRTILS